MEEYAGFESGFAEVVKVKTSVDSGSKQVEAVASLSGLLGRVQGAVTRRYIAGNGSYISWHANNGLPPHMTAGSTMKSAAGKTQCVLKSQPGVNWLCSIA